MWRFDARIRRKKRDKSGMTVCRWMKGRFLVRNGRLFLWILGMIIHQRVALALRAPAHASIWTLPTTAEKKRSNGGDFGRCRFTRHRMLGLRNFRFRGVQPDSRGPMAKQQSG